MKTLIITISENRTINNWIGTLRNTGKYSGDVLIIDYDELDEKTIKELTEFPRTFVRKETRILSMRITDDRHRAIYNALYKDFSDYDVVMCIDCDTIFANPVQPLLDMATEKICYTPERKNVEAFTLNCIAANDLKTTGCPDYGIIWNSMLKRSAINGGLYLGPIDLIRGLERFMVDHVKYGINDQLWLNTALYGFDFPSTPVEDTWNYDSRLGYKKIGHKVFDAASKVELNIIHFMGNSAKNEQQDWRW